MLPRFYRLGPGLFKFTGWFQGYLSISPFQGQSRTPGTPRDSVVKGHIHKLEAIFGYFLDV